VNVFVATVAGKPVQLINVDKVGGDGETTRALVLTFSERVPGLSTNDIILGGAGANAFKGALRGSDNVYTMSITNFTAGNITVSVQKDGYNFTVLQDTVAVYIKQQVWGEGTPVNLSQMFAYTPNLRSTSIYLIFDTEIRDLREENIVLTSTEPNGRVGTVMKGVLEAPYSYTYDPGSGIVTMVLYSLGVYGDFANNTLAEVEVRKDGYQITNDSTGATLYNRKAVRLISATANGVTIVDEEEVVATTDELTLTFSGTVPDITAAGAPADFISITKGGEIVAQAGEYISSSGYAYKFRVFGFTKTLEDVTVTVANEDYAFSPDNDTVTLHYVAPVVNDLVALTALINAAPDLETVKINYTGSLDGVKYVISSATNKRVILDLTDGVAAIIATDFTSPAVPNLVGVVIPSGFTSIAAGSFVGSGLKEVELNGPATIPASVFNLDTITSVTIGEDVTTITAGAFTGAPITDLTLFGPSTVGNAFALPSLTKVTFGGKVTEIGTGAFLDCVALTSVDLGNVETIGSNAFKGCILLPSITITDSVSTIGAAAFSGCTTLTTVTIPNTVSDFSAAGIFEDCTNLGSVIIEGGVQAIGNDAFKGCLNLASVEMPNSVQTIGSGAFQNCTSLTGITLSTRVVSIEANTFNGSRLTSIDLSRITTDSGGGGVAIGANAFTGTRLSEVTLPAGITGSVASTAFTNCAQLRTVIINGPAAGTDAFKGLGITRVTIANGVAVPANAFDGCATLATVNLGTARVAAGSIAGNAFKDCVALSTITLPAKGATDYTVATTAFAGCTSLDTVTLNGPEAGTDAFAGSTITGLTIGAGVSVADNGFTDTDGLASVTFSGAVGDIGENAFKGTVITAAEFPSTVGAIKASAFEDVESLTSVSFGGTVGAIGNNAFKNTRITAAEFPSTITSLGDSVFEDCSALLTVTFGGAIGTTTGNSSFANTGIAEIVLPTSVTTIGNGAFTGSTSLLSITINGEIAATNGIGTTPWPANLTHLILNADTEDDNIGGTFPAVTNLTIGPNVTKLEADNFATAVVGAAATVTLNGPSTGTDIFAEKTVQTLIVGPAVPLIADSFKDTTALTSLTLTTGRTANILGGAFDGCTGLTSVTLPAQGTTAYTVAATAFDNCTFGTVTLNGPTLGTMAFAGLSDILTVTIGNGVTVQALAFGNDVTTVTIGNDVTVSGTAFGEGVTTVVIGNDCTIETGGFNADSVITTVRLGTDVDIQAEASFPVVAVPVAPAFGSLMEAYASGGDPDPVGGAGIYALGVNGWTRTGN
jgi:hypothetical protein